MLHNRGFIVLMLVALFGLNACVVPPPRERVVYHDQGPPPGYQPQDQAYSDQPPPPPQGYEQPQGRCHSCGVVRGIDQVQIQQQTTGGGAILGAIIGGVIGNSFGRGGGRAAATAVGAVGGAVVGNSVEENNARLASGYAWRFYVELDDGRSATVTQYRKSRLPRRRSRAGSWRSWQRPSGAIAPLSITLQLLSQEAGRRAGVRLFCVGYRAGCAYRARLEPAYRRHCMSWC